MKKRTKKTGMRHSFASPCSASSHAISHLPFSHSLLFPTLFRSHLLLCIHCKYLLMRMIEPHFYIASHLSSFIQRNPPQSSPTPRPSCSSYPIPFHSDSPLQSLTSSLFPFKARSILASPPISPPFPPKVL